MQKYQIRQETLDEAQDKAVQSHKTDFSHTEHKEKVDAPKDKADPKSLTPMMQQYVSLKEKHPDCLLFFRMGDFYEMFFEDAEVAAQALDIALTKRGQVQGESVPMCGVPVHALDTYLARLIRRGHRVAICEQLESPIEAKKRGAKSVVKRDVVRIVTPGTLSEEELLEARTPNYLAALTMVHGQMGLAWLDISTGAFSTELCEMDTFASSLSRLEPKEILLPESLFEDADTRTALQDWEPVLTPIPSTRFNADNALARLLDYYLVETMEGFGDFHRSELAAAGALLDYVDLTQKGRLPRLEPLHQYSRKTAMTIDGATRRNLELTVSLSGSRKESLLAVMDHTQSAAGARLLLNWLNAPLLDPASIAARQDAIDVCLSEADTREKIRTYLKQIPDIERALSRLALGRGGPKDLASMRDSLLMAEKIRAALSCLDILSLPPRLKTILDELAGPDHLQDSLQKALVQDLPNLVRDGGFIAPGYDARLDDLKALRDESRRLIASFQSRYINMTRISTLKIKHNNVLGYFIEVTASQAEKMPRGEDAPFIHRQSLASAIRYTTIELNELEQKIASAGEKALALEGEIFQRLVADVLANDKTLSVMAHNLAALDVFMGLAHAAAQFDWRRPTMDTSLAFEITAGRHPVVEALMRKRHEGPFIPNDCDLSSAREGAGRLWLLTGPNMAGKSTFLRQNALLAIMAQMGSFIPAQHARIGVVDRLFSRVGAADDLARGRSTFMVEMVECATILNQAGERSLVILDEIGRGTATYDGLSIAWAAIEHLHDINRSRALFATHYHELTALAKNLDGLSCHTMQVKEWQGEVVFLHEVGAGSADRSYGIHVARLAGLPAQAITRAEEILRELEQSASAKGISRMAVELPLFQHSQKQVQTSQTGDIADQASRDSAKSPNLSAQDLALQDFMKRLEGLEIDDLTPRAALDILYELAREAKNMIGKA